MENIFEVLSSGQVEGLKASISERSIVDLCARAKEILIDEPNVKRVDAPVTICGDIHGQYYDLLKLFQIAGGMEERQYLFLGDFVDRGYHSLECYLLLLVLKVKSPDRITLLRGNHECRQITQTYGFYEECLTKYNAAVWRVVTDTFDYLPVAAVVENRIFCVHGGLGKDVDNMPVSIDKILELDRKMEVPHNGPLCDFLWSDPEDLSEGKTWELSARGAGYYFGDWATHQFLLANKCDLIVRSHQLVMTGFQYKFNKQLVTVWSAPNYGYRAGNLASILSMDEFLNRKLTIFDEAERVM